MTTTESATSSSSTRTRGKRPPPKTSSERGRTFRVRQQQREAALLVTVTQLHEQIQSLQRSRLLRLESLTRQRHTIESPHTRTIYEFFTLCQDGLARDAATPHGARQIQFKENYMRYVYAPDAIVGDTRGVDVAIHRWRLYTDFHERFHLDIDHLEVVGSDEHPVFLLHVKLLVRVGRTTFQHVFPHALADERLVQKFLHRLITYDAVVRFGFDGTGRIDYYDVSVDFIGGLLRAGGTLDEVTRMMAHSAITPHSAFREPDSEGLSQEDASAPFESDKHEAMPSTVPLGYQ